MRRLETFDSLSALHRFSSDYPLEITEKWLPIKLLTADGTIMLLPGEWGEYSALVRIHIWPPGCQQRQELQPVCSTACAWAPLMIAVNAAQHKITIEVSL